MSWTNAIKQFFHNSTVLKLRHVLMHHLSQKMMQIFTIKRKTSNANALQSCGNERRIMIKRSWVRIGILDGSFSEFCAIKNTCTVAWKDLLIFKTTIVDHSRVSQLVVIKLFLKNGPIPASFSFIFGIFKQTIQFYNKSMWKMSIQHMAPGFELTTSGTWVSSRPGLPP